MIETLKLALEALEDVGVLTDREWQAVHKNKANELRQAIREHAMYEVQRLGQEIEQEPVKIVQYNCTCGKTMKFESEHGVIAPQREWQGLTDEDYKELHIQMGPVYYYQDYGHAIEAKLKELNT